MADISIVSPQQTEPPTIVPPNVLAKVGWELDGLVATNGDPVVQLTASPGPDSITPNDATTTTVGHFVVDNNQAEVTFTVAYPNPQSPFEATLTAKLFQSGNTAGAPDATTSVTVKVQFGGGGGG